MDGTRTNDDKQSVLLVGAINNGYSLITTLQDGFLGLGGLGDLVLKEVGGSQRVVTANSPIFRVGLVANVLVGNEERRHGDGDGGVGGCTSQSGMLREERN